MQKMKRKVAVWTGWLLLLALMTSAMSAVAAEPSSGRRQIESSLLVSGEIDVEPNGSVSAVTLDRQEKLPEGVVNLLRNSALRWKFEPVVVEGRPARARVPMSVRLVAKRIERDQYRIEIRSASFEDLDGRNEAHRDRVTWVAMAPPDYPRRAFRSGASGTVYLILKIGRDGRVQEAVAEQVNLRMLAAEIDMRTFRNILARSALAAASEWTFRPPSEGAHVNDPYWTIRIPVSYALDYQPAEGGYDRWISYVPGPRERAPWVTDEDQASFSPDALAEGGVYMANENGPRLLTPLQGG